jgi:hypothetical protein
VKTLKSVARAEVTPGHTLFPENIRQNLGKYEVHVQLQYVHEIACRHPLCIP